MFTTTTLNASSLGDLQKLHSILYYELPCYNLHTSNTIPQALSLALYDAPRSYPILICHVGNHLQTNKVIPLVVYITKDTFIELHHTSLLYTFKITPYFAIVSTHAGLSNLKIHMDQWCNQLHMVGPCHEQ